MSGCNCFVAQHPQAAAIDAALGAGEDPRRIAERFGIGKSKVYEHRKHRAASAPVGSPTGDGATTRSVSVPRDSTEKGVGFHGTVERPAKSAARARPEPQENGRGTVPEVHGTGYLTAVQECVQAISTASAKSSLIPQLVSRYGITRSRARQAYYEAARHLRLDMGGYLERLEVSIAWVTARRDDASARAAARDEQAAHWREEETYAVKEAENLEGMERVGAMEAAAKFGLLAAKYGMEAEKWSAQALAHQRHLDDIQGLNMPKEIHATQVNVSDGGNAALERFGEALAERFKDRPDVLAALEEAALVIAAGAPGVIDTTGEPV